MSSTTKNKYPLRQWKVFSVPIPLMTGPNKWLIPHPGQRKYKVKLRYSIKKYGSTCPKDGRTIKIIQGAREMAQWSAAKMGSQSLVTPAMRWSFCTL